MGSRRPPLSDDFGEEGDTVIDGDPLLDEHVTPLELPRCSECGALVFVDDYSDSAEVLARGMFAGDKCIRSRNELWHFCANYSPTHKRYSVLIPR